MATYYRKFHDRAVSELEKGRSGEQVIQDLVASGVPPKIAERITWAVEHELVMASSSESALPGDRFLAILGTSIVFGCATGFAVWRMSRDGALTAKALISAFIAMAIVAAVTYLRPFSKRRSQDR